MRACLNCEQPLAEEHRFCPCCGTPARPSADPPSDDPMDATRERPAVRAGLPPPGSPPAEVPSAPAPPLPPARYPLFADEVEQGSTPSPPAPRREAVPEAQVPAGEPAQTLVSDGGGFGTAPMLGEPAPDEPDEPAGRDRRRSALPWLAGALALALMASVGTLLMLSGGDDGAGDTAAPASGEQVGSEEADADAGGGSGGADEKPDEGGKKKTKQKPAPSDVAQQASVTVPDTAEPNQDVDGNLVRYEGRNMLDGVPTTAWRMSDSAAGEKVVLQLAEKTRLTEVGLINGYAKSSGRFDWYEGNRRIRKVVWIFDGDKKIAQEFDDVREMQTMKVKPVATETVRIRITRVSTPGDGAETRNYTAISEVSLVGSSAS